MWIFPGPAQWNSARAPYYFAERYFFPCRFKVLHLCQQTEKASHKNQHFLALKTMAFFFVTDLNKWDLNTGQSLHEDFDLPFFKG